MNLSYLAPVGSVIALLFAAYLARGVLKSDPGSREMVRISMAVRKGAGAYLKRQYRGVFLFFVAMFLLLAAMAAGGFLTMFVPFAFITGGFFSGLSGFIGMKIATAANCRTACAATDSLNSGLKVAFKAGAVMGFTVVGLGLFDLSFWFFFLKFWYSDPAHLVLAAGQSLESAQVQAITSAMLTFGMGASSMALFARVGGGIYTKAADVGADLVGKVEIGIPEDDPRNPAVIADNVGDNVGDVAGMGADLYESYVGSVISTAALAVAAGLEFKGVTIPMALASVGILASILGSFLVSTREDASQKELLTALRRGIWGSGVIIAAVAWPLIRIGLGPGYTGVYAAVLSGLVAGILIGYSTEYFTSDTYGPTQKLADSSVTGPGTVIIRGISLGMYSCVFPVLIVGVSVLVSFYAAGGSANFNMGLYGIGLSAVGMLSTLGITLATDAYGPIADNAGGIAEMAHLGEDVRKRTDALDSLGNTTAATGKGFAIGSAALTALALFVSYAEAVKLTTIDILDANVIIGLFIGGMLTFLFSAMTMESVSKAAHQMIEEVRRQFREKPGILAGTDKPDYASCVSISTTAALREMFLPGLMAVAAPLIVGLLLGPSALGGLLTGSLVTGVLTAIFMSNSGGAWDNAKKYIEEGHHGGKGSPAHKAAVVGDTVGDPFKDTSGPSINILIKLMTIVSLVFAPLFLQYGGLL